MADKTYLVRQKPPQRDIYWVTADSAVIQGEHLVFLNSKGKLLVLILLDIVEAGSRQSAYRLHVQMEQIRRTITVQEAAPLWDDPRSVHLKRWGETFDVPLDEFLYGHIATYERERLAENVSYPVVWAEVKALRALLQHVGLGEEIESHYTTPFERVKLTAEERAGLTPRVRAYIEYLEGEISQLSHESDKIKGTLRKINWGRKR
jgi:hypothetical protein